MGKSSEKERFSNGNICIWPNGAQRVESGASAPHSYQIVQNLFPKRVKNDFLRFVDEMHKVNLLRSKRSILGFPKTFSKTKILGKFY